MAASELKLVAPPGRARGGDDAPHGRGAAVALGLLAIGCALGGSLLGADRARKPSAAIDSARDTLNRVLDRGPSDPEVLESVANIRRQLGERPLDARSRVLYAALLLEMVSSADDCPVSVFHAGRAAELAPVTVPVHRAASLVLARCGAQDHAVELIRRMFGYEPDSAAALFKEVEPFIEEHLRERALPHDATAWMAWSRELRGAGRTQESEIWADQAYRQWPKNLDALQDAAARAVNNQDWVRLGMVLPPDGELPEKREAAVLYAYRARARAEAGDAVGTRKDTDKAAALAQHSSAVLLHAGDALRVVGEDESARRAWRRALFELSKDDTTRARARLLVRLARLEDELGQPAAALRAWREVLDEEPDHSGARRRVSELAVTGR
jgi:hypothetical protein